jgi:hypothetical protein
MEQSLPLTEHSLQTMEQSLQMMDRLVSSIAMTVWIDDIDVR